MSSELRSYSLDTDLCRYIQSHLRFLNDEMLTYPDQQNCTISVNFKEIVDQILNLEVRPDDIWLVTFPKCGTTWTQEMLWLIQNDFDYEGAKVDLGTRFPFIEIGSLSVEMNGLIGITVDQPIKQVRDMKSPRMIKSHLPVGLLPRQLWKVKPKIVYVLREPKDVVVSFLNHYFIFYGYTGSKEKFFEAFLSDHILWGSYWGNVAPFWKMRHQPNVLINTFEDMKRDLPGVIHRTAAFLGKTVPEDKMDMLLQHLHFSNMRDNDFINYKNILEPLQNQHGYGKDSYFLNKGQVGYYKEKMSPEWIQRFDEWTQQEKIKYGLNKDQEFPY